MFLGEEVVLVVAGEENVVKKVESVGEDVMGEFLVNGVLNNSFNFRILIDVVFGDIDMVEL